jgi:hypothetical protein
MAALMADLVAAYRAYLAAVAARQAATPSETPRA